MLGIEEQHPVSIVRNDGNPFKTALSEGAFMPQFTIYSLSKDLNRLKYPSGKDIMLRSLQKSRVMFAVVGPNDGGNCCKRRFLFNQITFNEKQNWKAPGAM